MANDDTLATLAAQLPLAFQPFASAMQTDPGYLDLLKDFGWDYATLPTPLTTLRTPFSSVAAADPSNVPDVLSKVLGAFQATSRLGTAAGLDADFQAQFPRQLADAIVGDSLLSQQPRWGYLLYLLGILRVEEVDASGARPAYRSLTFALEDVDTLLADPVTYLKGSYAWGQPSFDGLRLLQGVYGMLTAWGLSPRLIPLDTARSAQLTAGSISTSNTPAWVLRQPFIESTADPGSFGTGVELFILPQTAADMPGFAILPYATGGFDASVQLTDNLTLGFGGGIDLTAGVGALVRPNKDAQFLTGLSSGSPTALGGNLTLSMTLGLPSDPSVIVGDPAASRLQFGGISTALGTRAGTASKLDVYSEFALQAGQIVIKPAAGDADGFLATLLPSNGIQVGFDLTVGFSTQRGLYFRGSGAFELVLPVHLTLGPVSIESAKIAVRFQDGGVPVDIAATIAASLGGVIAVVVQDVGLTADFTFPSDRAGSLGPVDLALDFKPPSGAGISINAGPVSGGGFVAYDSVIQRYSGAFELSIYSVSVKAFGLVDTKLPDGSKGYSFVVVISAEFTPIQLGLGFTLIGVGGLVGINRSLNSKGLSDAVRAGSLEHVLFPHDPVHDAPAIINDLATIFPASKNHYVFGPMAKLGWGTPTLINAELGVVLELPGPRIALLGVVQAALPSKQVPLLSIHLAVAGSLDFPKRLFSFDASLYDSHVNGFNLTGDTSLRLSWGDNANFAFAMGGFNPVFQPPPGFPTLKRVAVDVGINGNPRLTAQGYFALTSNTAQVGASLDLHASGAGIDLDGHLGFDALFVFSPFSFEADFSSGVSVSFHGVGMGIDLHGTISGPSPFHVDAQACVSVFIWDACLPISVTFGSNKRADLPPLDPFAGNPPPASPVVIGLQTAVADPNNWSGSFPKGVHPVVTLSAQASGAQPPIDPVGQAALHQKVCPLNFKLSRFGAYKPKTHTIFTLNNPTVPDGTTPAPTPTPVVTRDKFAPALFKDMSGAEKLSSKPYDLFDAGFTINPDNVIYDQNIQSHVVKYDTEVVDNQSNVTNAKGDFALTLRHLLGMLTRSAPALGGIRRTGTERFVDPTATVLVLLAEETFVVADGCSLATASSITGSAVQQTLARIALEDHLASQPSDRGVYRVVPAYLAA
jgi:hypothetical protein